MRGVSLFVSFVALYKSCAQNLWHSPAVSKNFSSKSPLFFDLKRLECFFFLFLSLSPIKAYLRVSWRISKIDDTENIRTSRRVVGATWNSFGSFQTEKKQTPSQLENFLIL